MHLGWSSRTYPLDAADFAGVPDYDGPEIPESDLPDDEVVLLIRKGAPDALLRGRAAMDRAGDGTVDVRIVFVPTIAKWNLLFTLARFLRDRRRYEGSGVYHISTEAMRQMGLERAVRTLACPHKRGKVDRLAKMRKLEASLKERGYDDSRPINVMLCRSRGCEDSLRQGHHRISACIACGVQKMAVHFSAAGALPRCLKRLVGKPRLRMDVLRSSLECHFGLPIDKLVPVDTEGIQSDFIVVPEPGGRFIVKLVSDEENARRLAELCRSIDPEDAPRILNGGEPAEVGGRYLMAFEYGRGKGFSSSLSVAARMAPAIIVPSLVAGALVIDVAVMHTACGERSLVAWFQFGCAFLSSALMFLLAALDSRCRAAYYAFAHLFLSMAAYELMRDVYNLMPRWISWSVVATILFIGACFVFARRRSFALGFRRLVSLRSFNALPFGLVSIWVVSKILSIRAVWETQPLSSDGVRVVKHLVEEGAELFGYVMVLCWAISAFVSALTREGRRE